MALNPHNTLFHSSGQKYENLLFLIATFERPYK